MAISSSSHLPTEVLSQIFVHLNQASLHACTLTSRSWYQSSINYLYHSPLIAGFNFDAFVASICPSKNAHIRHNGLGEMVRVLDMSQLVHSGRKSLTARLLGRLKERLEVFVAPQATFGVNCLASISKSRNLHTLNLSVVSEGIPYSVIFAALENLDALQELYLPHAFVADTAGPDTTMYGRPTSYFLPYPPNLTTLHILGGMDLPTLKLLARPPLTLHTLHLAHLTRQDWYTVSKFLKQISSHPPPYETYAKIKSLTLGPNIAQGDLFHMRKYETEVPEPIMRCPALQSLRTLDILERYFNAMTDLPSWPAFPLPRHDNGIYSTALAAITSVASSKSALSFPHLRTLILRSNALEPNDHRMHDRRRKDKLKHWVDTEQLFLFVDRHAANLRVVRLDRRLVPPTFRSGGGRPGGGRAKKAEQQKVDQAQSRVEAPSASETPSEEDTKRWTQDMRFLDDLLKTFAREEGDRIKSMSQIEKDKKRKAKKAKAKTGTKMKDKKEILVAAARRLSIASIASGREAESVAGRDDESVAGRNGESVRDGSSSDEDEDFCDFVDEKDAGVVIFTPKDNEYKDYGW